MSERGTGFVWTGAVAALLCLFSSGSAGAADVAIGGKAGSLGLGVELTVGLGRQWNTRLGVNGFSYSDRREESDIEYDAEAKLRTATALLDFHPGGRGFRLTAGAVWNGTKVEGSSLRPDSGFYDIGGVRVPADILGTLDAEAEFDPFAPYLGLGWGNAVGANQKIGFSFDVGAIFQGTADVELTPVLPSNSPINTTPGAREALQILLDREESEIEDDAADYDIYPVVSIGVTYRF
jgi:hypothetical protein